MNKKHAYLIIFFLILACSFTFGRIAGNDFINLDDPGYITENHIVQSGLNFQNIKWAFTTVVLANWHPLTMIAYMLEWQFFGANPAGYHIVSLILHIGAVIFLFLFLYKSTNHLWPSAFAAALFAFHPLRVESVAWVAEQKDVLSMFLGMACLYAYSLYCEKRKFATYLICLLLFILSLLSKPMLVTLPFLLMLLDFWPLNRWQKALQDNGSAFHKLKPLIYEKIPFICLSLGSSIITIWAQQKGGAVYSFASLPLIARITNAVNSYTAYLEKIIWPVNLAVFYPFDPFLSLWKISVSVILLICITIIVFFLIKKMPFLFVGWFWYLGTLIPVIGIIQVGYQAMADRYTYLPSIGISIMLAWGIPFCIKSKSLSKKGYFPAFIIFLFFLSFITWKQCGYWQDSVTLFKHTVQLTKNNNVALINLGLGLSKKGHFQEAINHFTKAIKINPEYLNPYIYRAIAHDELGQTKQAHADFNKAVLLKASDAEGYSNRGLAFSKLEQNDLAIKDLNEAIRLNKDYAEAYNNRGAIFFKMGNNQKALEDFNKALSIKEDYAQAYNNRGAAFVKLDQNDKALEDFSKAIHIKKDYTGAYFNRSIIYAKKAKQQDVIEDLNIIIRIKPNNADYYYKRGIAYGIMGQNAQAVQDFDEVIRIKPNNAEAFNNRGICHAKLSRPELALADFQKAIRLKPDYADAFKNRAVFYLKNGEKILGCLDAKKACSLGDCQTLDVAHKYGYCR